MKNDSLLESVLKIAMEQTGDGMVSLYVLGSYLSKDMTEHSDIDLVGIMRSDFDFNEEKMLNERLNATVRSTHKIDVGMMNYEALYGEAPQGSILSHIDLPVFLNFLKKAKLVHGKDLNFDGFPIKPASLKEELRYHLDTFNECKGLFREKDLIGQDFTFRDFVKTIFYIANIELAMVHGAESGKSYSEIAGAFVSNENHIVHYSMKLRKKKFISQAEKIRWLKLAEHYVGEIGKLAF